MVTYPSDWKEDKVSNVVDISTGCRDTQDNKSNGRYPFFVRSPIVERIDVADYDCEAVLTAGDGVGTGKVFHYYSGKFAAHQRVYVMNNFREVDGKYFHYFFSRNFIKEVEKYTAKSSVDSVRRAMIADMKFVHPHLPEQQEIVQALNSFGTYIDDLSELIEKKCGIRDGVLEDLMSGRTKLGGFNKEWIIYQFKQYFSLLPTNTCSRDQLSDRGDVGDIHYGDVLIKYGDVLSDDDEIPRLKDASKLKERSYLQTHDVLIADTAEDETVGKAVQIGKVSIPLVGGLHTVACRPNFETAEGFLGYYMNSSIYHDQLYPYITGIKVSSVSKKSFGETELCIPADIDEQKAIVSVLRNMDEEIKALEAERDKMIQIREGAIDDLLTGRVRLSV